MSFDELSSTNLQNYDLYNNLSTKNVLTLNDIESKRATEIDDVYDFLSSVNTDQLSDFNFNLDLDMSNSPDSNIHRSSNSAGTEEKSPEAMLRGASSTNSKHISNLDTSPSKGVDNSDILLDDLKRSFTRLKQTRELIDTEKVYICSLKILETAYLNNFMAGIATPIYFHKFRRCVTKLLESHQVFYDNLVEIYSKWYQDSSSFLQAGPKKNSSPSPSSKQTDSSEFEKFNFVANEKQYLEAIVKLISNESIDTETYSTYCSLYSRVLKFSSTHSIEKYKRNPLIILNDYLVEHKKMYSDYLIDDHLDTRFISVVQMPTTRMVRYKLILESLLKNIELDEKNKPQLRYYEKTLINIKRKIDEINSFVGNEELKLQKLHYFRSFFSESSKNSFPNDLFLENIENLQISSSFGLVYSVSSKKHLASSYVCGFLFKKHLILAKCSNSHSNLLDIKLIIPLTSILYVEDSFSILSSYEYILNLKFEDNFSIYEIGLIFPNEKELLLWRGNIKLNIDRLGYNNNNRRLGDFWYSGIQRKTLAIDSTDGSEKFNVSSYIPDNIKAYKSFNNSTVSSTNEVHFFDVDHFNWEHNKKSRNGSLASIDASSQTELNANPYIKEKFINDTKLAHSNQPSTLQVNLTSNSSPDASQSLKSNSNINRYQIIKISLQERVSAQTCISSVWSPQFEVYSLNISLSRSLSNMFHSKLSILSAHNSPSTPNNATFIPPSPSFANYSGSLGSPGRLRSSKSMRSIKELSKTPPSISKKSSTDCFHKVQSDNSQRRLSLRTDSIANTPKHNIVDKRSSSSRSISSILSYGAQGRSKANVPASAPATMNASQINKVHSKSPLSFSAPPSTSAKLGNGVTKLWKNLKPSINRGSKK